MDEKDLFNRDTMFWREVNITSADAIAKVELNAAVEVNDTWVTRLNCILLPFQSHDVEYEMENGGAFKKNEVRAWPYVILEELDQYQSSSGTVNEKFIRLLDHDHVESIELANKNGKVLLKKAKI